MDNYDLFRVECMLDEFELKHPRPTLKKLPVKYFILGMIAGMKNPTAEEARVLINKLMDEVSDA